MDDADGDGDGRAGGVVQLQPRFPDRGTGRDVHGHLDGDADLVVVELRGRGDEHDPQSQPPFAAAGSYTVSLTATSGAGSNGPPGPSQ